MLLLVLVLVLLILLLILVLILVLVLILLVLSAASVLLVLEHQFGVDVILFGVKVVGSEEQGLPESLHCCGVVFLLKGYVAAVVVPAGGVLGGGGNVFNLLQGLSGAFPVLLAVQGRAQIVIARHREGIFDHGLAVVDLSFLESLFFELAVACADFPPVGLGAQRETQRE